MATISIEVEDDVLEEAKRYAAALDLSVGDLLRVYLAEFAEQNAEPSDFFEELELGKLRPKSRECVEPITWIRDEFYERG